MGFRASTIVLVVIQVGKKMMAFRTSLIQVLPEVVMLELVSRSASVRVAWEKKGRKRGRKE